MVKQAKIFVVFRKSKNGIEYLNLDYGIEWVCSITQATPMGFHSSIARLRNKIKTGMYLYGIKEI